MWRWVRGRKAGDCVHVHKAAPGQQWRIAIDGARPDGTQLDDKRLIGLANPYHVGRVHSSPQSNVLAAFCRRCPPKVLMDAGWTEGNDDVEVSFSNEIEIDLAVWIVHGPYCDVSMAALDAIQCAGTIFRQERMGVRFGDVAFHDATSDAKDEFLDFKCESAEAMQDKPGDGGIGFEEGKINIYFVRSVYSDEDDSAPGDGTDPDAAFDIYAGTACGTSDFVVVASAAGESLLVHELGHCLWLDHVNTETGFNAENVMWSSSSSRAFLTEGQLFRAHLLEKSALNRIYEARPGEPTLGFVAFSGLGIQKLPLEKRLFPDGDLPAN
jgi:hypothetical protein